MKNTYLIITILLQYYQVHVQLQTKAIIFKMGKNFLL